MNHNPVCCIIIKMLSSFLLQDGRHTVRTDSEPKPSTTQHHPPAGGSISTVWRSALWSLQVFLTHEWLHTDVQLGSKCLMINFARKVHTSLHTHSLHPLPLTQTQSHSNIKSSEWAANLSFHHSPPARPGGVFKQQFDPQLILPQILPLQHTPSPPVTLSPLSRFLSVSLCVPKGN